MSEPVRNWFATPWVASRYVAGRPDVHGATAERIRARVAPAGPLARSLDVACGTGLSARAMGAVAEHVFGIDLAASMLREARRAGGAAYTRGRAESLPFTEGSFDLVTIGCAWHWCEPGPFLDAVARVLRPGGWLVIYDSYFRGDDGPLYASLLEQYWKRLERIDRRDYFVPGRLEHEALVSVANESLDQRLPMTLAQVLTLTTSQASTVGNVELGSLTLEEAERTLDAGLTPFFDPPDAPRDMLFTAPLHFVRRLP